MILRRPDILSNCSQGRKIKNFTAIPQGDDDFLFCNYQRDEGRKMKNFSANAKGIDDILFCAMKVEHSYLRNHFPKYYSICCNLSDSL